MKKKRAIKIIKREAECDPPPPPTADEIMMRQQKDEAEGDRDMTKAVKKWINERRENSEAEVVFSNSMIFGWDANESPKNTL